MSNWRTSSSCITWLTQIYRYLYVQQASISQLEIQWAMPHYEISCSLLNHSTIHQNVWYNDRVFIQYIHTCVWETRRFKGCVSLDPSKISKSGWWGLQLDTWQCNSLWYGLINSKLHINKKNIFFISHNIRRCHTSNVLNHPAYLSVMDLTSDPSWFTHFPGKASTKRYSPQFFKGSLLFSLSTANKETNIVCHLFWYQMTVSAL